jgi:hypothetical protein
MANMEQLRLAFRRHPAPHQAGGVPSAILNADKPPDHSGNVWEDKAGANMWFTKKFL